MFSLRKLVGAVALAATALGLAGCGDVGTDAEDISVDSAPIAVQHAAAATAAQPTANVATTIRMTINGRDVTLNGTGQLDTTGGRYEQRFDATELLASLVGTPPPGATAPFTVVVDDRVTYVQFPGFDDVSDGKPWMKFDAAASGNGMNDLFGGTGGGAFTSDPSSFLRFLQGAGKVTEVGQESVAGSMTTHYAGTYTVNDAYVALGTDQRDRVTRAFDDLGFTRDARDQPIDFDAWVSADGLVRRVSTSFDMARLIPQTSTSLASSSSPPVGQLQVSVEYSDFGTPVDIQVPPADQVQDLSTLVPQLN